MLVFEEFSFGALPEAHGCPRPPIARQPKTGNQFIFNDFLDASQEWARKRRFAGWPSAGSRRGAGVYRGLQKLAVAKVIVHIPKVVPSGTPVTFTRGREDAIIGEVALRFHLLDIIIGYA